MNVRKLENSKFVNDQQEMDADFVGGKYFSLFTLYWRISYTHTILVLMNKA